MKFSMIVSTMRGIENLEPLFITTSDEVEIIIIDKNFTEEKKQWLKDQGGYERIIYVPMIPHPYGFRRDFSHGLNLALAFVSNDWIIRADDSLELKYNFFEEASKDIAKFNKEIGEKKFLIIAQKAREEAGENKFIDYFSLRGFQPNQRYVEVKQGLFTWSFGIAPLELFLALNGYDIRYDIGWGNDDADFLNRAFQSGMRAVLDKQLFGYLHSRGGPKDIISITKLLYEFTNLEVINGKAWAYNPYKLKELRESASVDKEKYTVYKQD